MTRAISRSLVLVVSLAVAGATRADAPMLVATGAWSREAPPGATRFAAYMTIHDRGDQDRAPVSADRDRFDHVMLHRSAADYGGARMMHEERVVIPARGSLRREPDSFHLMIPAPDERLLSGDSAGFVLHFETGEMLQVDAPVQRAETP